MDSREFAMPKKISAVKIRPQARGRRMFTPGWRLALMLIVGSATFVFAGRISAETPSPVTIKGVFDPDLADVKLSPDVKRAIKDATEKTKPSADGCYPAAPSTFTTHQKTSNDPAFDLLLGQARAAALQQALTGLGYSQGQVKTA